ncbi:MAG: hypothetical protein MEQ07_06610 [Aquimonas sp.]|nr:hypothetical protein [Aquimonas sp.]
MLRTAASLVVCFAFVGAALAQENSNRVIEGDVLLIDRVERTHANAELPRRGMLMGQVERRFGAPSQRLAPVGGGSPRTPPITRWVYPEFTVYFENSHVVNAVVNRAGPHERGPRQAERPAG